MWSFQRMSFSVENLITIIFLVECTYRVSISILTLESNIYEYFLYILIQHRIINETDILPSNTLDSTESL